MTSKTTDEIVTELTGLYNQMFIAMQKRRTLIDNKNRVLPGKDKEELDLRNTIKARGDEIRNLLEGWIKEQPTKASEKIQTSPSRAPVFEPKVDIDFNLVKDAFSVGHFGSAGYINVPMGEVYVFGNQSIDDVGFPEVYIGGEVVSSKNKDKSSMVATLFEAPGEICCIANQWLAGISISKDDPAKTSIRLPIRLHDPRMTLIASRGSWLSQDGRKNMNHDIHEQLRDQFQEILTDPIQIWSSEKQIIKEKIHMALYKYLESWGLRIIPELVSIVRQYPKNLYEIVLQFDKAEQFILDMADKDGREEVLYQSGLTNDELTYIQAASQQSKGISGAGLFHIIKDKVSSYSEKSEPREKIIDWLRIHGGANAANYFREISNIYSLLIKPDHDPKRDQGTANIRLSEQVISHAFRNPLIGLGEWLEILE
jgi:hypothetical protein